METTAPSPCSNPVAGLSDDAGPSPELALALTRSQPSRAQTESQHGESTTSPNMDKNGICVNPCRARKCCVADGEKWASQRTCSLCSQEKLGKSISVATTQASSRAGADTVHAEPSADPA